MDVVEESKEDKNVGVVGIELRRVERWMIGPAEGASGLGTVMKLKSARVSREYSHQSLPL